MPAPIFIASRCIVVDCQSPQQARQLCHNCYHKAWKSVQRGVTWEEARNVVRKRTDVDRLLERVESVLWLLELDQPVHALAVLDTILAPTSTRDETKRTQKKKAARA